jgi:hypothetical protein
MAATNGCDETLMPNVPNSEATPVATWPKSAETTHRPGKIADKYFCLIIQINKLFTIFGQLRR